MRKKKGKQLYNGKRKIWRQSAMECKMKNEKGEKNWFCVELRNLQDFENREMVNSQITHIL